jgi:hypothetical protein
VIERYHQIVCEKCGNKILPYQRYCRKCASYNRYYDSSYDRQYNNSKIKRSEPTKYTIQLAKALYSTGIDITLEPEIWYTSCNFYTPDIELKNAYNMTVTNFIKNIIFYGKPRVAHTRLVWIKHYKAIVSHINDFNEHFYKFGITVEEAEVKTECLEELQKIQRTIDKKERIKQQQQLINEKEMKSVDIGLKHLGWLDRWLEEAKSFEWLSEWLGHKGFFE